MKRLFLIFTLTIIVALPTASLAGSITVGDVEFNPLSPGVNDFTVNNFTGTNNLGFFPAADNLVFNNVVLMATESNGTVLTFNLGNVSPGTDTSAQISSSLLSIPEPSTISLLVPGLFGVLGCVGGRYLANRG